MEWEACNRRPIRLTGAVPSVGPVLSVDMHKGRLEAFSDAVIAIILTVMVLEFPKPGGASLAALWPMRGTFLGYLLSFVYLAIYWNNHHHMFQAVKKVDGAVLWANMHLLFWLSLVPFVTDWLGRSGVPTSPFVFDAPVAAYGFILMLAGIAYYILSRALIRANGEGSPVALALGSDLKGKVSVVIYVVAIGVAFLWAPASCLLFAAVAAMWLVPDRRFEKARGKDEG